MKKYLSRSLFILFYFVSVFCLSSFALADDSSSESSSAGAAGFTFNINYPENQIDDVGYYDLKMTPGQTQVVTITLSNPSSEEVTVDVSLNGAKTNVNGVIEYGDNTIENDASLKFDFKDIVTGPSTVTIPASGSKDLELEIKMPETSYDGIILGGIKLQKQDSDDEDAEKSSGSVVKNKYAYAVGMILRETDVETNREVKLNKVYAGSSNYTNAIFVNLSNVQPEILKDVSVEVQISKKGSSNVLYESKTTQMKMAPNSMFDYPVSMNGERMVAGDYTAKVVLTAGSYKEEWEQDFEITQKDADKFNERDVNLVQEKGINWKLILAIVAGVVVLVVIIFVVIRLIKKNKSSKKKPKKKSKK